MTGLDGAIGGMLVLAAAGLYWASAVNARDRARYYAGKLCRRQGWQLLDQTVTLSSLWPTRSDRGLQWQRRYRFDFSPDGGQRRSGELIMTGPVLTRIWAELDNGEWLIE